MIANFPNLAPRHACFFAQQTAKKAPKAALIFPQIEYPRRHKLNELRDLLPTGWRVKTDHPHLRLLAEWAVEARYFSESSDATPDDARDATKEAREIYESMYADLIA